MSKRSNRGFRRLTTGPRLAAVVIGAVVLLVTASLARTENSRSQFHTRAAGKGFQQGRTQVTDQSGRFAGMSRVSETGLNQIAALLAEKESRTPAQRKIDSQLLQAVRESRGQQMTAGIQLQRANVDVEPSGNLLVDISGRVTDQLFAQIKSSGGVIVYSSDRFASIRATISLSQVEGIAALPDVKFIRPAVKSYTSRAPESTALAEPQHRPFFAERAERVRNSLVGHFGALRSPVYYTGVVDSEGDRTHRADDVRSTFGYAGEGVRIGVLSDSFNFRLHEPMLINSGDLPGPGNPFGNLTPVTVVQESAKAGTDEGSDMLQIVHDIAPRAQLFFASANNGEASFAANILALRQAPYNCDIIIDDVGYFDEAPFQDGMVAQAVNTVTADGALYFSSAGNEGSVVKNTAGVWEGDFTDAGSTLHIPGNLNTGTVLNFGTSVAPIEGDIVTNPGRAYTLSWSDPLGASNNDYDLFLMDSSLSTVKVSSTNIQNGSQDPFEIVGPASTGDRLVVFKSSTAAVRAINLNTFGGTLSIATTGQTHGHSAAINAFSVAAAPAAKPFNNNSPTGPFPNAFSATSVVENFTSDGPRRIFFNADGSAITPGNLLFNTNGGVIRQKPDITAADGVTTADNSFPLPIFYGTSAAAPHAGAIAALLKSASPSLTPAQIRSILITTALDIESPGFDNVSGFGVIQAFQAMQSVQPNPVVHLNMIEPVAVTEGAFSNHNGKVEPGESANLVFTLSNPTQMPANNVKVSVFAFGIKEAQSSVSIGTIAPHSSGSNGDNPLVVGLPSSIAACGGSDNVFLVVSFDGDASPQQFPFTINTGGSQATSFSAFLGGPVPSSPSFRASSTFQGGILTRDGNASSCGTTPPTPTVADSTGSRATDVYAFINNGPAQCVTVTMTSANGANLYAVAYSGLYSGILTNGFLGAAGSSSNQQTFSFMAPQGQFSVIVHEVNPGGAVGSPYTLSVSLFSPLTVCEAPPACNLTLSPATIPSPVVGTPFSQTFTGTGGSGIYTFVEDMQTLFHLPHTGLTFSGNTLSGIPTQAGLFQLNITMNDLVCTGPSQDYNLRVLGDLPASITATSGNNQSTPPGSVFSIPVQATVRDSANKPLPGVSVFFHGDPGSSPPTGTFGGPTTVITDANGVATAPPITASSSVGNFLVHAEVNGLSTATFSLNNGCNPITVTSNADSGPGTLRDAVQNICKNGTIIFANNVTGTITLTSGEIVISKNLFLQGPGANVLSISGGHKSRVFTVAFTGQLSMSGLTIRDGAPTSADTPGGGGGILLLGSGFITDSVIRDNDATNASSPSGGGIEVLNGSGVGLFRSAVINNTATLKGGAIHAGGGGVTITDSTIAGNSAGALGEGGGVELDSNSESQFFNATVYGNSANIGGNISRHSPFLVEMTNTIVAGGMLLGTSAQAADVNNVQLLGDFNLIQDTTGSPFIRTSHEINGVDPLLLPLGNYGGSTPSMIPQPNSPVINSGAGAVVNDTDQRGLFRRSTGNADMGSVEVNYALSSTGGDSQSTKVKTNFAIPLQIKITESGVGLSGITVTFTAPTSGPSGLFGGLNAATVVTNADGIASAPTLTANSVSGSYGVIADIGGSVPTISFSLTNLPSVASVTATTGTPQNTAPGATFPLPLQAIVRDSDNNPLSGISVTFNAPASGASGTFLGSGTSFITTTDAKGIATAPLLTANVIAGSYTVTANVDGSIPAASFNLNNIIPGSAAAVIAISGTPQNAGPGFDFGLPLGVRVSDGSGIPVNGATVTFTIVANAGAGGQFPGNTTVAVSTTDVNGHAISPVVNANQSLGNFTVNAAVSGVGAPAEFSLTNITMVSGDLNGDGQVTVQDLVLLANAIAGNFSLSPTQHVTADVFDDHSNQITITDLVTLANFIAGNIHSLPVVGGTISNPGNNEKLKPELLADTSLLKNLFPTINTIKLTQPQSIQTLRLFIGRWDAGLSYADDNGSHWP